MRKSETETMYKFNIRFRKILKKVSDKMYTMDWVKQTYLETVSYIDKDLWWVLIQNNSVDTLEKLMEEAARLMELKELLKSNTETHVEMSNKKEAFTDIEDVKLKRDTGENAKKKEDEASVSRQIGEITEYLRTLALLVTKERDRKDYRNLIRFNCGGKEHTASICKKPKSDGQSKTSEFKAFLVVEEPQDGTHYAFNLGAQNNKGMRLDFIADDNRERPINSISEAHKDPRTGRKQNKNSKKISKIKKKSKKRGTTAASGNSEFTNRVLEAPVPMNLKEVLALQPKKVDELIEALKNLKKYKGKRTLLAHDVNKTNIFRNELLTYVLVHVEETPLPLFIDTGARYSIISSVTAKKLNVPINKLDNNIRIRPVKGDDIEFNEYADVPLKFEDNLVIPTRFIIIKGCAVPVLLGLDVLDKLKARINYEEEVFTLMHNKTRHNFQLYSEESLFEEFYSQAEDSSDSGEESEATPSDSEESASYSDDESVPLFYSCVEGAITGTGIPSIEDLETEECEFTSTLESAFGNKNNAKVTSDNCAVLKRVISTYQEIFVFNLPNSKE
ncbi:hypothetical protein AYI69_g2332 [Smittium culicis]|uniref:Peptidase A2 domain-containing protein n=1 Tax=Smittium culicis TaxID=133412 RepID=A0A1R1YMQ4_9FUNG|nr:hypothetical protein AYI69_g2332 [Smittium culicis]